MKTPIMLLTISVLMMSIGCKSVSADEVECVYWRDIVRDPDLRSEILGWLDTNVFGRVIETEDRKLGRLVIPGRHGSIDISRLKNAPPGVLAGAEIRPIYFYSDQRIGAVFVGRYNGIGILVDQVGVDQIPLQSEISESAFEWSVGRFAVSCMVTDR